MYCLLCPRSIYNFQGKIILKLSYYLIECKILLEVKLNNNKMKQTIELRAIPAITLLTEIFNYSLTETKVYKLVEWYSGTFLCGHPVIKFHKRLEFNTIVFWIIYLYYSLLWNPFPRRISANFFKKFYCLHTVLWKLGTIVYLSHSLCRYIMLFLCLTCDCLVGGCFLPALYWIDIGLLSFCSV